MTKKLSEKNHKAGLSKQLSINFCIVTNRLQTGWTLLGFAKRFQCTNEVHKGRLENLSGSMTLLVVQWAPPPPPPPYFKMLCCLWYVLMHAPILHCLDALPRAWTIKWLQDNSLHFTNWVEPIFQVKFLMNKPGAAMVEMSDHVACNTVIQCLGGQELFGNKIDFRFVLSVLLIGTDC